jgi:hypothetical protein
VAINLPYHPTYKGLVLDDINKLISEIDQLSRDLDDHVDFDEAKDNLLIAQAYAYLAIAKANLLSIKYKEIK